jgi:hypothetical protein
MQTIQTASRGIIRLVGARTSRNRIKLSLDAVLDWTAPLFVAAPRSDRRNDVINLEKTFAGESIAANGTGCISDSKMTHP